MSNSKPLLSVKYILDGLSVSLIFLAEEAVFFYGVFGGIGLFFAILLAFLLFLLLNQSLQRRNTSGLNPETTFISSKKIITIITGFMWAEFLISEGIVGMLLLEEFFGINKLITVTVFLAGSIFLYPRGRHENPRENNIRLMCYLGLAAYLPIYAFLQKGLETVYNDLLHFHPRVLHLSQNGWMPFLLAATMIMFSKLFLGVHDRNFFHSDKKTMRGIGLAAIIWSTVALGFSAVTFVTIANNLKSDYYNHQILLLIEKDASFVTFCLFVSLLLIMAFFTFSFYFYRLERTMGHNFTDFTSDNYFSKTGNYLFLGVILGLYLAAFCDWSIMDVFISFGIIHGATCILLIFASFWRKPIPEIVWLFPLIGFVAALVAELYFPNCRGPYGVLISSASTCVLLSVFCLAKGKGVRY